MLQAKPGFMERLDCPHPSIYLAAALELQHGPTRMGISGSSEEMVPMWKQI